jgi:hypothetical protein
MASPLAFHPKPPASHRGLRAFDSWRAARDVYSLAAPYAPDRKLGTTLPSSTASWRRPRTHSVEFEEGDSKPASPAECSVKAPSSPSVGAAVATPLANSTASSSASILEALGSFPRLPVPPQCQAALDRARQQQQEDDEREEARQRAELAHLFRRTTPRQVPSRGSGAGGSRRSLRSRATTASSGLMSGGSTGRSLHIYAVDAVVDPLGTGRDSLGTLVALMAPTLLPQIPLPSREIAVPMRMVDKALRQSKKATATAALRAMTIAEEKERGYVREAWERQFFAVLSAKCKGLLRIAKKEDRQTLLRHATHAVKAEGNAAVGHMARLVAWSRAQGECWAARKELVAVFTKERTDLLRAFKTRVRLNGAMVLQRALRRMQAQRVLAVRKAAVRAYIEKGLADSASVTDASYSNTPRLAVLTPGARSLTPAGRGLSPGNGTVRSPMSHPLSL